MDTAIYSESHCIVISHHFFSLYERIHFFYVANTISYSSMNLPQAFAIYILQVPWLQWPYFLDTVCSPSTCPVFMQICFEENKIIYKISLGACKVGVETYFLAPFLSRWKSNFVTLSYEGHNKFVLCQGSSL